MCKCSFFCNLTRIPLGKQSHHRLFYVSPTSEWERTIILLVYFFLSHLCFLFCLSCFSTWCGFSNFYFFFLVITKATMLKGPRGVGYLTGKTTTMWRPYSSLIEFAEIRFAGISKGNNRTVGTSILRATSNPFTAFENPHICIHLM